ncbi:THO complex subunit 1-like isoform X2 [Chenopodium quinoa]|uniref:THO complex subunit 1-like isoform X2 n=1 Tax=Chenopodium quinoa TaxID=63459 RepID=UPI000B777DCF|nr:THO complex subunit 1-like isoform X2 [Chenopodium quinoa]
MSLKLLVKCQHRLWNDPLFFPRYFLCTVGILVFHIPWWTVCFCSKRNTELSLMKFINTSCAVQSGEPTMHYGRSIAEGVLAQGQIPRLLDIVLYLCEKEHVEGGMIFQLLEDLTEMSTMKNCKDIFAYIESKQDLLGKQELFARGKLVMLRTCNQLLRRLSKANDVVFCGRILMFLAHFFPLSERSAVNIKGVFNTSNETKYEKEAPNGISIDFNFYKTFWSLQEYFCNPPSLTVNPTKWHRFTSSLSVVLNTFEAQPLSDEEGNANNLEEEGAAVNIKYLTSSKLMGLELKDPSFWRHVLVQCLILFDYVKPPGKSDKDLPSEAMKEEIKTYEERVKNLLEVTPPRGKEFLCSIEHILEREKNWVWWKRDGCPPFEKQQLEKKVDGTKKRRPRWRLGNKELSQLWKWADQNPNALTDPERVKTPAVTDYWKPMADDMDPSAGIEAEYHHKNNKVYCWKGLRFSARQDLEDFSRFTEFGIEGVVPLELMPPEVRSKYQAKPNDKSKRVKKDETKGSVPPSEENQTLNSVSEMDGEGGQNDLDAPAAAMDLDSTPITGNNSQAGTPTPDDFLKQSSESPDAQEAGELDAEADPEPGLIDGETDADVDLDAVG